MPEIVKGSSFHHSERRDETGALKLLRAKGPTAAPQDINKQIKGDLNHET
jgi:hypothetical protein